MAKNLLILAVVVAASFLPPSTAAVPAKDVYKGYILGGISLISLEALLIFGRVRRRAGRIETETELATASGRLRLAAEAEKSGEWHWDWDVKSGLDRWVGGLEAMFGISSNANSGHVKMEEEARNGVIGRLIAVQEEERKRIAREIHDDYSQRLAMLAIDLEEFAEEIRNSPVDAGERLLEIWNGISELGADLHSLSHSLHSSTLESLGLIEGARAFCEEFAGQQKIQVDFAHENVPRDVPEDAALCLFRIVQESLRNVKRHSGADTAEVRLEASGENLHLSVADRGMGFRVNKRSARDGIGIRSMEERLRSLGGHLEIDSRPMEGTRIDAWLPLNGARPACHF